MPDLPSTKGNKSVATARTSRKSAESERRASRTTPVLVVGPSGFYGEGLRRVLHLHQFRTVAQMPTLQQAKPFPAAKSQLVLITDTSVEPDLAATVSKLRADNPAIRIAVFVDTTCDQLVEDAMRIPAHAFLSQKIGAEALIGALEVILGDGGVLSINFATYLTSRQRPLESVIPKDTSMTTDQRLFLSSRESDILRCLTDGISNKLIARQFDIAESTVKIHVKSILRKINVQNRTQAAIWALAHYPPAGAMVPPAAGVEHLAGAY